MLRRPELMGRRANVLDQGPIGRARETCENCPVSGEKNRKNYVMIKSTPTLTLTQSGLLAMLLQRQRYAVIQLARRRTHRKHMRAALWSALTWPWRALTAPRLDSRQAPGGNRATLESFTKVSCRSSPNPHLPQAPATIHHDLPLWTRDVVSQRLPFLFTHVKQLAAIVALGCLFIGLSFGVSTSHAPRPSYPYYDTQKLVPPWNEPTPLEGNRDRRGEYR